MDELSTENIKLKDELLKAKLASIDTLKDTTGLSDDTKTIAELTRKNIEYEQVENQLKTLNKQMEDEAKDLVEQLRKLEESVDDYKIREERLKQELSDVEESKLVLAKTLESYQKGETDELVQLREKVDTLLDTEERLIDRLTEKEQIESQLRHELENQETCDNSHRITELEITEKELKDELNELERCCDEYKENINTLEDSLSNMRIIETSLKEKLQKYELNEKELQSKLLRLEDLNAKLLESLDEKTGEHEISTQARIAKQLMEARLRDSNRVTQQTDVQLTDITMLQNMEKAELVSKVKQLESLEVRKFVHVPALPLLFGLAFFEIFNIIKNKNSNCINNQG